MSDRRCAVAAELGYDFYMWPLIRLIVVGFALGLFATVSAAGQINGVPASVTSIGFGGHGSKISGVPPSITSLGPNGFGPRSLFFNEPACCINPLFPLNSNPRIFSRHHNHFSGFTGFVPFYAAPYAPVIVMQSPDDEQPADDEYNGGPTIFDRRGSGRSSRESFRDDRSGRDERESQPAATEPVAQPTPTTVADQPQTVLVFKDGHQLEVQNYAVIGDQLYDLTPGHRRKIALAELDLIATAKQNDDRGIDFELPISAR
jgi:hypothetical protein